MPPCEGGYKEFKIVELFKAQTGDVDLQQKDINGLGTYFINSGVQNFGIKGKTDRKAKVFPANTITIDFFGNSYYRSYEYKLATHNHVFSLSGDVIKNELVGLYLTSCMSYMRNIFSFNNMGTWSVIKNLNVILPVTKSGEIDFQYIEERMRELEEERMRELEAYLAAAGFANCDLTPEEQVALRKFSNGEVTFTSCRIDSLFKIATGRDIIIGRTKHGDIPLISHQHSNNGISQYVQAIPDRRIFCYKDTLPLADRGVFLATTQNKDFHIGTRVKALTFKTGEQSENTRLFLVSAINKLQIFFTEYLTNATDSLPNLEIKLPIAPSGEIDYGFMGTYISAIKKQIIARLKAEIAREHKAYESVIND